VIYFVPVKVRFKLKDWMAVLIGALAVLLAAGGVLMPDWVKDHWLNTWQEYAILALLVLLTIICLLVLQRDLSRADAEREAAESEQRADQAKRDEEAAEREAAAIRREKARDKREDDRDKRFEEFLSIILAQMVSRGQEDTALFANARRTKEAYDEAINERKRELRVERAMERGDIGKRDEMVRHGGDLGERNLYQAALGPFVSVEDLRARADEKLRVLLQQFKVANN
jgi:hypothetical protein